MQVLSTSYGWKSTFAACLLQKNHWTIMGTSVFPKYTHNAKEVYNTVAQHNVRVDVRVIVVRERVTRRIYGSKPELKLRGTVGNECNGRLVQLKGVHAGSDWG